MPNSEIFEFKTSVASPKWLDMAFLLAVGIFVYLFVFKLPFTPFFTESDQLIFLYEAERMLNGDVIYRDFFEFTLPGTQVVYLFLFSIFGLRYWIAGAAIVMIGLATALTLLQISKKLLPGPFYFLPAAIYIFFGFRWFGLDGSHRMFSPVFILLAVLVLQKGHGFWNLAGVGILCGFASFFTQQRGFAVLAAFAFFLFFDGYFRGESRSAIFKAISVPVLSFAASLTIFCLYFIVAAGFDNFFQSTIVYPAAYYRYGHPNNLGVFFADMEKALAIATTSDVLALLPTFLYGIALPFSSLILLISFLKNRRRAYWEIWRVPVLLAVVGLFLTFSTSAAPNQYRLFQIAAPSLIVLVWLFYYSSFSFIFKHRITYSVMAIIMILALVQAVRIQTNWQLEYLDTPTGRLAVMPVPQAERYIWLAKNTQPNEYFFEVYEPFIYFPLRLKNPTRFGQIWPSAYTRPEHIAEVVRDLSGNTPQYILWDNSYIRPEDERPPGDHTGLLAEFVQQNYSPIGTVYDIGGQPIQIWERKPQQPH